jgi:hypothetical protein
MLCEGNSLFNTDSFLSGEYRVTHSSLALCSIDHDLMRVTTSLTQGAQRKLADGFNGNEIFKEFYLLSNRQK